jgi:hypothetical protein
VPRLPRIKLTFSKAKNSSLLQIGLSDNTAREERLMAALKRFLIERDIPGVGGMSLVELCGAARASNHAIDKLGGAVQWQHSYVAADKTYCIYLAEGEAVIRRHAEMAGIPVSRITEIPQIIDPLTANN